MILSNAIFDQLLVQMFDHFMLNTYENAGMRV